MGVHELGLRKAILKGIDIKRPEADKLTQKEKVSDAALPPFFFRLVTSPPPPYLHQSLEAQCELG